MGLSAALLRRHPVDELPKLDRIWKDDPDDIRYPVSIGPLLYYVIQRPTWCLVQCVTAILGNTNPRDTYKVFDAETWRKAVDRQWDKSGLPNALRRLTSDLVVQARRKVLIEECAQFLKQVRKIIINQKYAWVIFSHFVLDLMLNRHRRVLLEMRRSRDEFETARNEFQMARAEFTSTLQVWTSQERFRDNDSNKKLALHLETLQKLGTLRLSEVGKEMSKTMSEMVCRLRSSNKDS